MQRGGGGLAGLDLQVLLVVVLASAADLLWNEYMLSRVPVNLLSSQTVRRKKIQ